MALGFPESLLMQSIHFFQKVRTSPGVCEAGAGRWDLLGGELPTDRVGGWTNPGDFNGIFVGAKSSTSFTGVN